jgi:concanavalin A-like lectin/glucanase superfamily protein/peptide-N-glycosidase F-like protein/type IX secretion system substrate protein
MNNKILLVLALTLFCFSEAMSQDTTVVQTLEFSDITKRRGFYVFPPKSNSYQKVLMYHTLKCDPATTRDKYPCGEWDYIALSNIYEHQNPGTPYYTVNGKSPDTVAYSSTPTFWYQQRAYDKIVYDNTISENDFVIGNGDVSMSEVFKSSNAAGKYQMLFTASELSAAGITAGSIDKLRVDVLQIGSKLSKLKIKMKHSSLSEVSAEDYETKDMITVFEDNVEFLSTGSNDLNLPVPFDWDGTSNVIVEFTFTNKAPGLDNLLNGSVTSFASAMYANSSDSYLEFIRPDYIDVPPATVSGIDSFLTVSAWVYGNPDVLPADQRLIEAKNEENRRVLNVHVPYSDETVYFDAGHNTSSVGHDRISMMATPNEYEGSWHHWAFVKDVSMETMTIYVDGYLWLEEGQKKQPVDPIHYIRVGAPTNTNGRYSGYMDELRIWKAALSPALINEYMHKDVDPSHPFYSDLLLDYRYDDGAGTAATNSAGVDNGTFVGPPNWMQRSGDELHKNLIATSVRPNITFVQGEYDSHIETVIVTDTIMNHDMVIEQSMPQLNIDGQGVTYAPLTDISGWPANMWSYTYGPDGSVVDSVWITADVILVNQYKQIRHQLQNFITPYGIGLDLGSEGFTWAYDVTDYLPILHDTVDIQAGNTQELIDLKFLFIHGTPPRDVIDFETLWNGSFKHAAIANNTVMPAVDVQLNTEAKQYRVKTRTTGHGFGVNNYQNCAEFCPKYFHLYIDGDLEFEWRNWTECATNPVIDQGGTWIYDRAGWCPGAFGDTYDHEIIQYVTPGGIASIDFGMETTAGGMDGNYQVTVQLVSYSDNNFALDAAVDEIIAPSDFGYHNRVNPICAEPIVVIKNTGSTTLTTLKISYKVTGGVEESFNWTGNLDFLETEEVTLPISSLEFWTTDHPADVFEVRVSDPNGGMDEYADNSSQIATFNKPDVHTQLFDIWVRTNSAGFENSYTVRDINGNVVLSRTNMTSNTDYFDEVDLPDGCYCLEFLDSDDDGLSFFANNDGSGMIALRRPNGGTTVKSFNRNFGKFIKYWFTLDGVSTGIEEPLIPRDISVAPNPSSGLFHLNIDGHPNKQITISVTDLIGRVVHSEEILTNSDRANTTINLSNESNGFYFIKVAIANDVSVHRVMKQ